MRGGEGMIIPYSLISLFVCILNLTAGVVQGNQGARTYSIWLGKINMFLAGIMFTLFLKGIGW